MTRRPLSIALSHIQVGTMPAAAMDAGHELVEIDNVSKTTRFAHFDPPYKEEQQDSAPVGTHSRRSHDVNTLARLGKRQVLKVRQFEREES